MSIDIAEYFTPVEIQQVKEALKLSSFELRLSPDWGSDQPEYRQHLHADLKVNSGPLDSAIYSISHTLGLGGYVLSQQTEFQLGFDIEKADRVSPEIANRICKEASEFVSAPSPSTLWTAKEAAFKALRGSHQPKVLSDISVGNWNHLSSQLGTFQFVQQEPRSKFLNFGIFASKQLYTFAFFIFRP
jgi:phosphopantetheinyl transferase